MRKIISICMIVIMTMALLTGCGGSTSGGGESDSSASSSSSTAAKGTKDNPFVLGVSPMSGWYAWYGVDKTGIFKQNDVYVTIQFFSVYSDSLTAFYSGQVDGICIAASDAIAPLNEGVDFKVVLVNDNSAGADALVVQKDSGISSIADLKGKTVATEVGTLEHMFLLKMLNDNNMTMNDINFTNMTINDAGPAFTAGSIDAAVLWEPTLSKTVSESGGTILYSTESEPGLIPDTLAVRQEVLDSSADAVQKIVDSWFEGVEKLNAEDEEFIQAVCDGAELEVEDYKGMLKGVKLFDKSMNQATFSKGEDYTSLPFTLQKSAEFLLDTEMIAKMPDDVTQILDDEFIK